MRLNVRTFLAENFCQRRNNLLRHLGDRSVKFSRLFEENVHKQKTKQHLGLFIRLQYALCMQTRQTLAFSTGSDEYLHNLRIVVSLCYVEW